MVGRLIESRREHEMVMYKICYMLRSHFKEGRLFRQNPNREALMTLYKMQCHLRCDLQWVVEEAIVA
jgi:hypothetical protein